MLSGGSGRFLMSVYIIKSECDGLVKIGHSGKVHSRIKDIGYMKKTKMVVLRILDGGPKLESWLHNKFSEFRLNGEWFNFSQDMLTVICPEFKNDFSKKPIGRKKKTFYHSREALERLKCIRKDTGLKFSTIIERLILGLKIGNK